MVETTNTPDNYKTVDEREAEGAAKGFAQAPDAMDDHWADIADLQRASQAARRLDSRGPVDEAANDREWSTGDHVARTAATVLAAGVALGTGAFGANVVAPHVEDFFTPDKTISHTSVELDQNGQLRSAMDTAAHDLVLQAKVDPSKVNFNSIKDRISQNEKFLGGSNIQPGNVGELELVDLGGTYTFAFKPNVQLPETPAVDG